ncbi:hypothetical protein Tco_1060278 [Tanacetum coccineum]
MRPRPSLSRLKDSRLRGNGVGFLYDWCESVGRDFYLGQWHLYCHKGQSCAQAYARRILIDSNLATGVMRFLALAWHLEKIYATWAHLEKKRTRLRLYTKNHEELFTQSLKTANTIELPIGNNVVPLRSNTIRLVQNVCSFHGLLSEDPNQHLKDFLKLVESLDLDGEKQGKNAPVCYFNFPFAIKLAIGLNVFQHDPSPHGRILLLISLLNSFHQEGLQNSVMISLCYNNIMENLYLKDGLFSRTYYKKSLIMASTFGSKSKSFMTMSIPSQNEPLTNRSVLENQVQRLMEAHLALTQPTQVNKITISCEICSGPHDTQYCMEDPEQAFVEYASSRIDEAREPETEYFPSFSARSYPTEDLQCSTHIHGSINAITIHPKQQSESHDDKPEENKEEEKDNPKNIHVNPFVPPDLSISFITEKVLKLNSFFESLGLVPQSSNTELVCTKGDDGDVMFIEIVKTNDDSHKEEPEVGEQEVEYFDIFPTRSELAYHKYLMCGPIPSIFLRNPIITEGFLSNLKIPCNIGHVHVEKAYIDPNSSLNIMTRMMYNWIMRRKLDPRENSDRGVSNFTGRIKGMHVFMGNFTYIIDFMIVEDISSIIDPRLTQVVLGSPFVEISNMSHDPPEGVVRFTNGTDEVSYKMPHKIE